jgi:hypothetical protein
MTLISAVMQTTSHGSDLQEKADQRYVPPGGSSGRTFFTGARRAGSGPGSDTNVIALRQPSSHDADDTNKHHRAPPSRTATAVPDTAGEAASTFEALPRFTAGWLC